MSRKIIERRCEGVAFRSRRRLCRKEGDKALGGVAAIVSLDKSVEITNIAQGIDLDVEKQLNRKKVEQHRRAQISFGVARL